MNYERTRLKWNGWGWNDKSYDFGTREQEVWAFLEGVLGKTEASPSVELADIQLATARLSAQDLEALGKIVPMERIKTDRYERVFHAKGKSYHDLIRIRRGLIEDVPDAVVYPETEREVEHLLAWAVRSHIVVVPFGGGTSVVGGVEAACAAGKKGIITLDMTRMNKLLEIDPHSMTATFEAGIYGPELEDRLQKDGFTLGHYPQSFEFSTLGGWIAARGAGQQSDRYGKAEDFLVAARVIAPSGILDIKPTPASAAGPDLKHLVAGSEGVLGIITQATVSIKKLPEYMDYRGYLFPDFGAGAQAIRQMMLQEIPVAMIRLSDEDETNALMRLQGAGQKGLAKIITKKILEVQGIGSRPALMLVGLEGPQWMVKPALSKLKSICRNSGGVNIGKNIGKKWYRTRFEAPYLRDPMLARGIGVDTLETACEWSRIMQLHQNVKDAIAKAIKRESANGFVMAHVSHSYKDGASLYYTFMFPIHKNEEVAQWLALKQAASDAILAGGGTISHHHGVGVDHFPWLEREKGGVGMAMIKAVRRQLDPHEVMNPGKLVG